MLEKVHLSQSENILPLNSLGGGQTGMIVSINMHKEECLRELTLLGIVPQTIIRMFANHYSNFIFKIGTRTIAVDREIAAGILVIRV